MKKSVGSFNKLHRSLILVLAVMFGVAASGLIAWQASAQSDSREGSKNSTVIGSQGEVRGMYRGVQTAVAFDVSPPLRTMKGSPVQELGKLREFEERNTGNEGQLGIQDIDKTVQMFVGGEGPNAMPTPIVSFDSGISCNGCQPPDPNGDVGPNHFVAMGNLQFQIFNKTGTSLLGPTNSNALWAGFGGPCQTENAGDPVVIYDQLDDRWILTQFTAAGPNFFNCVAVSTTPDPTGTYFRYAFTTGTNFPDYPKYGMWPDALYISTREFAGAAFSGVGAYAVNRAQLIAGNPAAQLISFLATPSGSGGAFNVGDGLVPTDLDGVQLPPSGSPNYFIGSMDQGGPYGAPADALTIWKFTADFVTPASSSFTLSPRVPIAAYDTVPVFCATRSCIPQPNTTARIDHLGYRQRPMFRAAYRNFGSHESIVTNQSVEASATMSGIRWWEIRSPNSNPVIHQEGTYAPGVTDGIHRWMGSIAMDTVGNMALGYSASAATGTFPSSWYTGRLANDPPGTMPQGEESIVNGAGSQTSGQRWGDYTDMVVDPVDDCTFWFTNEYIPAGGAWRMRVGSFKFPNCSLGPNFGLSVTPSNQAVCAPANAVYTVNTVSISGFTDPVTLSATGNPAGTVVTFVPNPVVPGNSSTMTISNTGAAAAGIYTINILGTSGTLTQNQNVTLNLSNGVPAIPTLVSPANGSITTGLAPTFTWNAATGAITYEIQVATDAAFTNVAASATGLTTTSWTSNVSLNSNTQYFWRVRAVNACGTGAYSPPFSFTTPCLSTYVESEPNNTSGTAQNLGSANQIELLGSVGVAQDQDFYQFNASAGERVWSYVYTLGATTSTNAQVTLFDTAGEIIQFDDDSGSQPSLSAAIAGAPVTASGAHQIRVSPFSTTATVNPYRLFLTRTSGASIPEVEPNETLPTANAYTAGTVVSGAVPATTDIDTYSFTAAANERMVIQVDGDPERDGTSTTVGQFNPNFRIVNAAGTTLVTVDSDSTTCTTGCPAGSIIRRSESHLFTFTAAGTYYIQVIADTTAPTTGTYSMHVWRPTGPSCGSPTPTPTGTPASPTSTNTSTATATSTATSTVAATSTGTPAPTCTPATAPYVVPPAYTSTTGTSTFTGPLANAARTYQLLIHANQLTGIVGQPITALTWRLPASATTAWPAADVNFTNYDIRLSGSVDPANRSLTDFSANVIGPQTLVRSGPLSITTGSYTSGTSPNAFGPDIGFDVPWVYTGGNLLIELRHDGFTGTSRSVDALSSTTAGYGTDFSAAWVGSYTGTSGAQGNFSVARLVTGGTGCPSPSGTPTNTETATATPTGTPAAGELIYGMTSDLAGGTRGLGLVSFNSNTPGTVTNIGPFTGVVDGHFMRSMDFRPATGQLYAISTASSGGGVQLYTVNLTNAALTPVGPGFILDSTPGTEMDFNPVADRIRLLTASTVASGLNNNFRVNPNDGTLVATDTNLAFDASDPQSGNVNFIMSAGAYSNNVAGATQTTLYAWEYQLDSLVTVGGLNGVPSPNTGLMFTVNTPSAPTTFNFGMGMDISGATGTLYATHDDLATGTVMSLYTRNTTTGAETLIGAYPAGTFVVDLSVFIAATGTPTATSTSTATSTATATNTPTPSATVQFSSATYSEDESQTAVITINRTGNTTGTTTVSFQMLGGTATGGASCTSGIDYIFYNQAVIFNPGETSRMLNVQLCGDTLAEPTETNSLILVDTLDITISTAVLRINDTANAIRNGGSICTTFGGNGVPYPSTITVSSGPASIGSMRVTLYDLTHTVPDSMDFLLVGPGGQNILLMADSGGVQDLTAPVTLTFSDSAGQVLPDSAPLTTGTFEATSWVPGQASFAGPAPTAPYNEPGSTVGGTPSFLSVFGTTNSNGTWSLYMRDDAGTLTAVTGCANGGWGLELLGATAANAAISGRVTTAEGLGIRNAKIIVTGNSLVEPLVATTGSFGYFVFEGLPTGETYVVTVNARRYTFTTPSQIISLIDNVVDADFIAEPQE